jgi:hypothetical protein
MTDLPDNAPRPTARQFGASAELGLEPSRKCALRDE